MRQYDDQSSHDAWRQFDDLQDERWRYQRNEGRDSLLSAAVKGAVAGLAATTLVTVGTQYGPKLMQKAGLLPEQGSSEEPTEKLAENIAEGAFDTELPETAKTAAGQAIHWGYGTLWGSLYGLAQHELQLPPPLAGALFGGLVGGVASTVVPAMNLTPPPTEQPVAMTAFMSGLHLAYGETVAVVYDMLE
jgi:hypothetical protein